MPLAMINAIEVKIPGDGDFESRLGSLVVHVKSLKPDQTYDITAVEMSLETFGKSFSPSLCQTTLNLLKVLRHLQGLKRTTNNLNNVSAIIIKSLASQFEKKTEEKDADFTKLMKHLSKLYAESGKNMILFAILSITKKYKESIVRGSLLWLEFIMQHICAQVSQGDDETTMKQLIKSVKALAFVFGDVDICLMKYFLLIRHHLMKRQAHTELSIDASIELLCAEKKGLQKMIKDPKFSQNQWREALILIKERNKLNILFEGDDKIFELLFDYVCTKDEKSLENTFHLLTDLTAFSFENPKWFNEICCFLTRKLAESDNYFCCSVNVSLWKFIANSSPAPIRKKFFVHWSNISKKVMIDNKSLLSIFIRKITRIFYKELTQGEKQGIKLEATTNPALRVTLRIPTGQDKLMEALDIFLNRKMGCFQLFENLLTFKFGDIDGRSGGIVFDHLVEKLIQLWKMLAKPREIDRIEPLILALASTMTVIPKQMSAKQSEIFSCMRTMLKKAPKSVSLRLATLALINALCQSYNDSLEELLIASLEDADDFLTKIGYDFLKLLKVKWRTNDLVHKIIQKFNSATKNKYIQLLKDGKRNQLCDNELMFYLSTFCDPRQVSKQGFEPPHKKARFE